jgi:hypothetical protein
MNKFTSSVILSSFSSGASHSWSNLSRNSLLLQLFSFPLASNRRHLSKGLEECKLGWWQLILPNGSIFPAIHKISILFPWGNTP